MKKIALSGYSGTIGRRLNEILGRDYEILTVGRRDFGMPESEFVSKYEDADIIIHLAGAPVIKRWNRKNMKEIADSRILTTRRMVRMIQLGRQKERIFISSSAIGIYSDTGVHDEKSRNFAHGFLRELIGAWESEALKAGSPHTKVVLLRTGVVLSKEGGLIEKLLVPFRWGLGGRIGSGRQSMSFIHMEDFIGAVMHIITGQIEGIINMVAPEPVKSRDFTKSLCKKLKRPHIFIVPGWFLRILFGKGAQIMLSGQAVIPGRLMESGFEFKFRGLNEALTDIVN